MKALVGIVLVGAIAGCSPSIGTCDTAAARTVVYSASGLPAYAGQSMLINSCAGGGTHCHSASARDRYGAPFEMNFDPLLTDTAGDVRDAEDHLYRAQFLSNWFYADIYEQVSEGAMPPGAIGDRILPPDPYAFADGTPVPSVRSAEGREILRNWLACGSPIVQATVAPAPVSCTTDAECTSRRCLSGTCDTVGAIEPARDIAPNWSSVYANILRPRCAVAICHGTEEGAAESNFLDMSTADAAYASLVGASAFHAACGTRIAPGDPDGSLLVQKIEGTQADGCGDRMPSLGATLTAAQIATIRQWITDGALQN